MRLLVSINSLFPQSNFPMVPLFIATLMDTLYRIPMEQFIRTSLIMLLTRLSFISKTVSMKKSGMVPFMVSILRILEKYTNLILIHPLLSMSNSMVNQNTFTLKNWKMMRGTTTDIMDVMVEQVISLNIMDQTRQLMLSIIQIVMVKTSFTLHTTKRLVKLWHWLILDLHSPT